MRTYDLHVRLNRWDHNTDFEPFLQMAQELTYAGLAFDSSKPLPAEVLESELVIIHRLTFTPRSATRLRQRIEKQRKHTELLVVHGRTKPIWLAAAELPTVDMVMLHDFEDFSVIDSQVARALAAHNKPIELCLHELLTLQGPSRSRLMRVMNTALEHLVRANCSLILTSGAQNQWGLRAPRDLAALSFLASVPKAMANTAIYQGPIQLCSKIKSTTSVIRSKRLRRDL